MNLLCLTPWFMECCINMKEAWESISTAPTERIHPSVFFTSKKSCALSLWLKTDFKGSFFYPLCLYLLCVSLFIIIVINIQYIYYVYHLCSVHVQMHVCAGSVHVCMHVESRQQLQVSFLKQHHFVFWDRVSRWLDGCQVVWAVRPASLGDSCHLSSVGIISMGQQF